MSILSELSGTLQVSIKDSIVDMYHTMFNKLNDVKDMFSKKVPEILPINKAPVKDEGYADPPATPKTGLEIAKATGIKIISTLLEYGLKLALIIFYLYLASLVANDMIIYAAPIRAFFFVFTLFFTITLFPCAFFVALYYLLKKGYDYYNQYLSSATVKPPLSFPMIFAILPLTTYYPTSPFVRFFLWAFMYQKSDKPGRMEKENKRLEIIMKNYRDDLHSSFEYLEKIKTTPPFSNLYEIIEKKLTIEGMHPIQKPTVKLSITPEVGEKGATDVTEEKKEKGATGVTEEKKEKVQFFSPKGIGQAEREEEERKAKEEEERKAKEAEEEKKRIKAAQPAPMPESITNQIKRKEEQKKKALTSEELLKQGTSNPLFPPAAQQNQSVPGQDSQVVPVQGYANPPQPTTVTPQTP